MVGVFLGAWMGVFGWRGAWWAQRLVPAVVLLGEEEEDNAGVNLST